VRAIVRTVKPKSIQHKQKMKLKVGDVFEFDYGNDNINNRTVEVKALFDDRVAVKTLKATNPRTDLYKVEHEYLFECAAKTGHGSIKESTRVD
jgi:hypothetical protein